MDDVENRESNSGASMSEFDFDNTCMLVSDSNEISNQLDSKQLAYGALVELAEDNLFKKYLDMSKYLTKNQYGAYKDKLETMCSELERLKNTLPNPISRHVPRLRVVDGQVILVDVDSLGSETSPEEYVRENWDVTSEYKLLPIPDCMLRGVLDVLAREERENVVNLVAQKQGNQEVTLSKENVPVHMHHSSVTTGSGFTTMNGDPSTTEYFATGNTKYDMFYNDSMDVGLSKNELDGTIDGFSVDAIGRNDGSSQKNPEMFHDNMPKYRAFYGFVVHKMT